MIQKLQNEEMQNKKIRNREMQKNARSKPVYQMIIGAAVVLALLGTFFPGWLLERQSREEMNMVDAVPVEYYSPANLAVARNASANLGIYQKLQLITGRWESNVSEADAYEREMENFEAVELAKEQMDAFYKYGLYPVSLASDYENWYSWEAEFCKVVDATFNTYAAYYWKLSFVKYDGTEKHQVYMLEDGTVFLAEAWHEAGIESDTLTGVSKTNLMVPWRLTGTTQKSTENEAQDLTEYLSFSDVDATGLEWLDLAQLTVNEQEYYMLQANSENRYVISLQPVG